MFFIGLKTEVKSHYRGHKMSLWLNLIPQLHQPGLEELSMRHHHFQEEGSQYYDGKHGNLKTTASVEGVVLTQANKLFRVGHLKFYSTYLLNIFMDNIF